MSKTTSHDSISPSTGDSLQSTESAFLTGVTTAATETSTSIDISSILFQCAVVIIGVVGVLANGFVIFVTTRQSAKNQDRNLLILNQLILDFISCAILALIFSLNLCNFELQGSSGWWLCVFIFGDQLVWVGIDSSTFNLGAVAIERYLKVCHPLWHKVNFRPWVVYVTIAFIWTSTIVICFSTAVHTTKVVNGVCFANFFFPRQSTQLAYGIWYFCSFYVVLLLIFVFCYSRIFATIRRQLKIFPGATISRTSGDTPEQKQVQLKLLKTVFLLTLSFTICWLPNEIHYLLMNLQLSGVNETTTTYFLTIISGFVNVSITPFVYAAKSETVNSYIRQIFGHCKKKNESS